MWERMKEEGEEVELFTTFYTFDWSYSSHQAKHTTKHCLNTNSVTVEAVLKYFLIHLFQTSEL